MFQRKVNSMDTTTEFNCKQDCATCKDPNVDDAAGLNGWLFAFFSIGAFIFPLLLGIICAIIWHANVNIQLLASISGLGLGMALATFVQRFLRSNFSES